MKNIGKGHTAVLAGYIGNVVEWYDFALYGYMAGILSGLFFPGDNDVASLIATYGVFAAGFIMRPIGSGIFGWLGDTIGRSKTMLLSVTMMALPTFLLGCLPTFEQIGLWAPVLLPQETLHDWGWRLPFLFGGVLGTVSIFMRTRLPRSPHFERHHSERGDTSPLLQAFTTNRRAMIQAVVFASSYGVLFYVPLVYLPQWLHDHTGMGLDRALQINTAATALLLLLIPLSGWAGDRFIRRTHFIAGAMLVISLVSWPMYAWLSADGVLAATTVQLILVVLIAVPLGSAPAMFAEMFPSEDRLSGYSVAYNLGLGVVGGATPMLCTWLIDVTGRATAPAAYMVAMAILAFVTLMIMQDRSREPLR